jgi:tRNA(Ile)-lysidine synthase
MGPAPAVAEVRRAVRAALDLVDGPLLVACSGGADSLALAAAVAFEAPRAGRAAGLATVDHGLHAGSAAVAARVAAIGAELGLDPVLTLPVAVGTAGGPEAAARDARYAALDAAATALDAQLLLGHTLDDQAETVLLGLGRGSGPRSTLGMATVTGRRVRPLLGVRRATTAAACAALGLEPWADPMNADPAYARARLRHEVLPLLEEVLQGGVAEALARGAGLLRADLDALDGWADTVYPSTVRPEAGGIGVDTTFGLDCATLAGLPAAVRSRVLRRWAADLGAGPLSAERTAALDALVTAWRGQDRVELPGGVAVRRAAGQLLARSDRVDG